MNSQEVEHQEFIFKTMLALIPENVNINPSEWAEEKRTIASQYSERSGRLDFDNSPYWREVVNCLSPTSPVREVAVMKPAQIGFTQIVLETIIGFIIDVFPRAVLYTSADKELSEKNMASRIDGMIASAGIEDKLKPSTAKKRKSRTGDTKALKEFYGGFIAAMGANNANKLRQVGYQIGLCDEVDTYKSDLEKQGSTISLIRARFMAFINSYKILWGSTPLYAGSSHIYSLFMEGDQSYYFWHCPRCGKQQKFIFHTPDGAGLKYELDDDGNYIDSSIFYQCENGCRINESSKYEMMLEKGHGGTAEWIPTATAKRRGLRSFALNALYSNFFPWKQVVTEWLECKDNKNKLQVFKNNVEGLPWQDKVKNVKLARRYQNLRPYQPLTIPNKVAEKDGNSKILILTCAIDVNGRLEERKGWLAFQIEGHCLNGQTYSIAKGAIHGGIDEGGSAWLIAKKIVESEFLSDDGIIYHINACGVDVGFKPESGYWFSNYCSGVVALAGRSTRAKNDKVIFKSRVNLGERWSIDTIFYKNLLHENISKVWAGYPIEQPSGYPNYPEEKRLGGLESFPFGDCGAILAGNGYDDDYFKCIGSEYPVIEKDHPEDEYGTVVKWEKKGSRSPNHFWDCMVYNRALRDIYIEIMGVEVFGIKKPDPISVMTCILEVLETENRHVE
ncbi:MAG: phage terminase large subunit family protein [Candidatus Celaenobacter antarcticus]|nr:phage terminase large subunit family protein [Candidatus Celaenobacter antarcticus]